MLHRSRWAVATLLLSSCAPSFAATQYYVNDRAGWLAATTLTSTITFDSAIAGYTPPPAGGVVNYTPSLIVEGFTIQHQINGLNQTLSAVSDTTASPYYQWNSGVSIRGTDYSGSTESKFLISMPGGITSFGIDLMMGSVNVSTYQVRVNGVLIGTSVPTFDRPARSFFGITSDVNISSIEFINPTGTYPLLDNLSYGVVAAGGGGGEPVSETPEASTLLLCASAFIYFSRMKRRAVLSC